MPTRENYEKASFASGEISPELSAASDLRTYQTGVGKQENMVTLLEGVMTRRPGTRFVLELKDETQTGKLWPLRYASNEYYMLVFNGGVMRVMRDASFIGTDGVPFEMAIPWTAAQLPSLRGAPLAATVTYTVSGGRPQVLTRTTDTNWSIAEYQSQNGPVDPQNLDSTITVLPSAVSGNITLAGVNNPFNASWLGGVMRLDEANASLTTLWIADEVISRPVQGMSNPDGQFGNIAIGVATTGDWIGYNWSIAEPISRFTIGINISSPSSFPVQIEAYGSNGAEPSSNSDGILLGTTEVELNNSGQSVTVFFASPPEQTWNNLWVRLISVSGTGLVYTISSIITQAPGGGPAILRRWGDNIYEAVSDGDAGATPPTHSSGDASYGGVIWRFYSLYYGFIRITAVPDANHASGTVILRLPDSALLQPSYRWSPPSWGDGLGWPDWVLQHQQRFLFTRLSRLWGTQPASKNSFWVTADATSALDVSLTSPDGSLVEIKWMASSGIVVIGTADLEWMLRAPSSDDVLQAQTIDPVPDSQEGSVPQIPTKVDRGVVFVGPTGKRLLYIRFNELTQQLDPQEVSAQARHIPQAGIVATAWQKDPNKVLWLVLSDGTLAGMTFMTEQKIIAFHRHPMANAFVEDIAALPSLDGGRVDVYMIVRRVINGQTRRYVELMQPFFAPADPASPTADGAWFVDCGLSYSGDPVTTISGADHLEGEEVAVFADGAMQGRKTVKNGSIMLDRAASNVALGEPIAWRVTDLPRSLQIPGGTSRGKLQRANTVIIDVLNAASGQVRLTYPKDNRNAPEDDAPFDDLIETGADDYGASIKLFTGEIPMTVTSDSARSVVADLRGDDAMPITLRAIVPDLLEEAD